MQKNSFLRSQQDEFFYDLHEIPNNLRAFENCCRMKRCFYKGHELYLNKRVRLENDYFFAEL